jgi:hypothetical protein
MYALTYAAASSLVAAIVAPPIQKQSPVEVKPSELIQGLLATISHHRRVYVVTVPVPAQHAREA